MTLELTLAILLVVGIVLGVGITKPIGHSARYFLIACLLATATACALCTQWRLSAILLGVGVGCSISDAVWTRRRKVSIVIILLLGALAFARLAVGPISDREFEGGLFLAFLLISVSGATSVGKGSKVILAATTAAGAISYAILPSIFWLKIGLVGVAASAAFDLYSKRRMNKHV